MGLIDQAGNTRFVPNKTTTYKDFLYNLGGGNVSRFPNQALVTVPRPSGNATVQAAITTQNGFVLTTQTGNTLITNQSYNI